LSSEDLKEGEEPLTHFLPYAEERDVSTARACIVRARLQVGEGAEADVLNSCTPRRAGLRQSRDTKVCSLTLPCLPAASMALPFPTRTGAVHHGFTGGYAGSYRQPRRDGFRELSMRLMDRLRLPAHVIH